MAVPFLTPKDFDIRPSARSENGNCTRVVALKSSSCVEMLTSSRLDTLESSILRSLNDKVEVKRHDPYTQSGPRSQVLFTVIYPCGIRASRVDDSVRKAISKFCRRHKPATTRKQERRIERHHSDRELRVAAQVEV